MTGSGFFKALTFSSATSNNSFRPNEHLMMQHVWYFKSYHPVVVTQFITSLFIKLELGTIMAMLSFVI
jgi:hypothetical protein